jgi:hypothetical protein
VSSEGLDGIGAERAGDARLRRNHIDGREVPRLDKLPHGDGRDELVEGIAEGRTVGPLRRGREPEVPRRRVLRADVAIGVRGDVVGLVPDDEVGARMVLSRRERLHGAHLDGRLRHALACHDDAARHARGREASVRVKHDLAPVHDEHARTPSRHGPRDELRRGGGLACAGGHDEEHGFGARAVGVSHAVDGARLVVP